MNDLPSQEQLQPSLQRGPSRFIPLIFMLTALLIVILSALLTRRASEERLFWATQTGQAFLDQESTRQASTFAPLATPTLIVTAAP